MEKYQLISMNVSQNHAGSKAPDDIAHILDELNYKRLNIQYRTRSSFFQKLIDYLRVYFSISFVSKTIKTNSVLFIQYPFPFKDFVFKKLMQVLYLLKKKNVKIISLLHDVDELRFNNEKNRNKLDQLNLLSDCLIVHNEKMIDYLISRNFDSKKLVNLQIFDYLQDELINKKITYSNTVTIAGSLDVSKAGYLKYLKNLNNVNFKLYGPFYHAGLVGGKNIEYEGVLAPSELPGKLTTGFGLIWDGTSIDRCDGLMGNYLRYNNPHKMSLYLSAGLPVIIWSEAAQANFVKKYNVGLVVDSINELDAKMKTLSETKYFEFVESVKSLSEKLRIGFFTKNAVKNCEAMIEVDDN